MILVKRFYAHNELRNYSYVILDNETGSAWVIDPYEATPIIDYIKKNGIVLQGILNTHQHFDHIQGNAGLIETFNVPVCKLKSSETIDLGPSYKIETLDTPGHTLDHQVFIWKQDDRPVALFSGDTLFNSGVGNCRGGGDVNLLYKTTETLIKNLPSSTLLYPGHDYRQRNLEFAETVEPENKTVKDKLQDLKQVKTEELPPATLGEEILVNPFLRLGSQELQQNLMKTHLSDSDQNRRELFIRLRQLRDQW